LAAKAAAGARTWRRPAAPTAPRRRPRSKRSKPRWRVPSFVERSPGERSETRESFLQKHVVRRIGRAIERAGVVAAAGVDAAARVDPLHRRDAGERAVAAMRRYLELEPRDIAGRLPCDIGDRLADERAAVDVLPARPGKMAADAFAIEQQGR